MRNTFSNLIEASIVLNDEGTKNIVAVDLQNRQLVFQTHADAFHALKNIAGPLSTDIMTDLLYPRNGSAIWAPNFGLTFLPLKHALNGL